MTSTKSPPAITEPDAPSPSLGRQLWAIALPAMLTNLATALFGIADMWAIGRLGDAPAQGAVELGAKFLFGLLNTLNFLRTGTVALVAQGAGRGDPALLARELARALAVSFALGIVLLVAMPLMIPLGLDLLGASGAVRPHATDYVTIRYWAGPVWLVNCVLTGWLIGRRRVRQVLVVEIAANLVHIALDLWLVLVADWGVTGVAAATVLSETLKFVLLGIFVLRDPAARGTLEAMRERMTWQRAALARLFALNRDLFLRTLLLSAALMLFARAGAQGGPVVLAANGILFQLFMLSTLILDGFESAAQVLCGEAKGAGARGRFNAALRANLVFGLATGAVLSALYAVAGTRLAAAFSIAPEVVDMAGAYIPWLALLPLLGVTSFVLDGVFVGAGWTRAMLTTMAAAMALYLLLLWSAHPLGNHGLWLAFTAFFTSRAVGQVILMPRLMRRGFTVS